MNSTGNKRFISFFITDSLSIATIVSVIMSRIVNLDTVFKKKR